MGTIKKEQVGMHCILTALYFLMLPLTIWTNEYGASLLKLLTIPIGGYFLISFIFYKKEFQINMVHLLLLFYTISTLLTLFVDRSANSVEFVIGYFLNAAIYICISIVSYNEREMKILEDVQVVLLIILTASVLYNNTIVHNRTTLAVFGQASDPNYFVGYFIFPIVVVMKKIVEKEHIIFNTVLMGASMYVIFQTGSRGGFAAVLVTLVAFSLIYPKKIKTKLLLLVGGSVFIALIWIALSPTFSREVIERMTINAVVESQGTHRFEIWESALKEIKNSSWELIFGRGIDATHKMVVGGVEQSAVMHNHFIQVIYNQGVLGFLIFFTLTGAAFVRCIKKRETVAIAILGMLALAVSLSFNQTTRTFWNLIAYAAIAFPKEVKETDEDKLKEGEVFSENEYGNE